MASDIMYLLEFKKHNYVGLFQDVIHNVMASDLVVPAGSYKWNYGIMQELFQNVRPDVITSYTQNIQYECLVFCDCTINGNHWLIEDMASWRIL